MARRRKRNTTRRKRRRTTNRTTKKKLVGFSKENGKFFLVFKKGKTLIRGKGRFKNKKGLELAARKHL